MTDHAHTEHPRYAEWDAAYVLGSLAPAERREFEDHLETCDRCRDAVTELSAMPGLLGRLDRDRAFALLNATDAVGVAVASVAGPPVDLVERMQARERERRGRRRIGIVAGVAAAAAVVLAVAIGVPLALRPTDGPAPDVVAQLHQVVASPLAASVGLTSVKWGTRLDMTCSYGNAGDNGNGSWDYAMWVIDRHGDASEVSSWSATSGSTVHVQGGTAVTIDQIASVEVRSLDDDSVLLSGAVSE